MWIADIKSWACNTPTFFAVVITAAVLALNSGCATMTAADYAESEPLWYTVLPLTVAFDAATFPLQAAVLADMADDSVND